MCFISNYLGTAVLVKKARRHDSLDIVLSNETNSEN